MTPPAEVVAMTLPDGSTARKVLARFDIFSPCVVVVPMTDKAVAGVLVPMPTFPVVPPMFRLPVEAVVKEV